MTKMKVEVMLRYAWFLKNNPETKNKIAKPNIVVFDFGANIGWFTLIFSKFVGPKGHVYSFEPGP